MVARGFVRRLPDRFLLRLTKEKVFFEEQVYNAFELLLLLVRRSKRKTALVDGHVDKDPLNTLVKKDYSVSVNVWTRPLTHLTV